jgi:hypothetical protein
LTCIFGSPSPPPLEYFQEKKIRFLKSLQVTDEDRSNIQEETIGQSSSLRWVQERQKRLTASNFGVNFVE